MLKRNLTRPLLLLTLFISFGVLVLSACTGDTNGGSGNDGIGTTFVADGGAGATLSIEVDTSITTGSKTGFFVTAKDPTGAPLAFVKIQCDSEKGIAILEPSEGGVAFEHTGPDGRMSGQIGALTPGSYLLRCEGPNGFGLRADVIIVNSGDVPPGFAGFPGAAGGNLGGGRLVDETVAGLDGISISSIAFADAGATLTSGGVLAIDTTQSGCYDEDMDCTPEPFSLTNYSLTLENRTQEVWTVTSVMFSIADAGGSTTAALGNTTTITPGEPNNPTTATVTGIFIEIPAGTQLFAGSSSAVTVGTFTVTATVTLTSEDGETGTVTGTRTVTFQPLNRCESGTSIGAAC